MEDLIEEVRGSFDEYGVSVEGNKDKIFEKCAGLCTKYSLDAETLVGVWLAFAATNTIDAMKESLLDSLEKQKLCTSKDVPDIKPNVHIPDLNLMTTTERKVEVYGGRLALIDGDSDSDNGMDNDEMDVLQAYGADVGTPKIKKKPKATERFKNHVDDIPKDGFSPAGYSPAVQAKSTSYGARTKAGDNVLRYKCKDSDYWNEVCEGNQQAIQVSPVFSTKKLMDSQDTFKYMFQKSTDISAVLSSMLANIGWDMLSEDEKELQDLRVSSVEECWYLGRIRNDEGRLSQGSTCLEGDLEISEGHVVSLDLSGAEEYRLFPGQVVILKGRNELGKCLRVSEVAIPSPLPFPEVFPNKTRSLNVMLAAGPFTPIDSFQYEPLMDLLEVLKKDKPDVFIIAGPFIDPSHPLIGEVADTFEDLFDNMMEKIKKSVNGLDTQVIVISTGKDAHHHAVYPTPPYPCESRKREKNVTILPDPAMFEVAGITLGFTTVDILKHLANSEIAKTTIADRMGGLSKLILSQRSFYPLYPSDESVPLDIQLAVKYCQFETTPHILVVPSDLRYFIKEVEGVIVINPERLTKGKSGGTYARFQVKLPDSIDTIVHSVADFFCGEILKI